MSLISTSRPRFLSSDTTRMERIESPPKLKKLSSTPTRSCLSTSCQISHNTRSVSLRGATSSAPASPPSGAGNAFRSTFPFPVSGSFSNSTNTAGTMYSGNCSCRYFRNPAISNSAPDSATTYPTNRFSPPPTTPAPAPAAPSPRATTTTALSTPAYLSTCRSISPSSIRYPLTFTCSSRRPINSSSPFLCHLTKSPVRYSRPPSSSLNRSAIYRSPVSPARFTYPLPTPAPPIYSSPTLFTGCTCSPSSPSTYTCVFPIGLPIGALACPSNSFNPASSLSVHTLQPTTVSVGPYSFTNVAAGNSSRFHLPSRSAPSCSPPTT